MSWIAVKDKLPDQDKVQVLLLSKDGIDVGFWNKKYIDQNNGFSWCQCCSQLCGWGEECEITHWMPLPDRPIEGDAK